MEKTSPPVLHRDKKPSAYRVNGSLGPCEAVLRSILYITVPVFRCFESDHFRTYSGFSASRIEGKIASIFVRVSIADLSTCSHSCKLKAVPLL